MRVERDKWQLRDVDFGPLWPYIQDDNVTDVDYNGSQLWVEDLTKGRYNANVKLTPEFINRFTTRVADSVNASFNADKPVLEAETDTLRVSIVHEAFVNTGRTICIRKTPENRRLTREKMLNEDYATDEALAFLENCVIAKMSMLMCGQPAAGKTEFLKYLTTFIKPEDRAITIEDSLEIHYPSINPGYDCVEMKVSNKFDYTAAIKASLRQNPKWILLSEARSTEVKYLLESMSTGTHCLTTVHTDDVRKVPDRIKNMCGDELTANRLENDVYSFLDVAVLVKKFTKEDKIIRKLDQICVFSRENLDEETSKNVIIMLMDEGKIINKKLPYEIMQKFHEAGIQNPFVSQKQVRAEREALVEQIKAEKEISITELVANARKYRNSMVFTVYNHEQDNIAKAKRAQMRGETLQ